MVIVVTICSANYLAHAKTLGHSLLEHNPGFKFVIGLVDRVPPQWDPSYWEPFQLIPIENLGVGALPEMIDKYDMIELNTAVKPFYIDYLYEQEPEADAVIYLDPDMVVYGSLCPLTESLKAYNLILTPHSCTFDDSPMNMYFETGMLSTGVYNLGFLATSRSETTLSFLKWWQKRLKAFCYYQPGAGLFVDQLWVTLSPLYFPGVYVEKHPGYNMCYWNHFERRLSRRDGKWIVNDEHPLLVYHFSSYSPETPNSVTRRVLSRTVSFEERPDLRPIYDDYRERLLSNGYHAVNRIPYSLRGNPAKTKFTIKTAVKSNARSLLRTLPFRYQFLIKRMSLFTLTTLRKFEKG